MHDQVSLGRCKVGALHLHKRMGPIKGTSGWCVVC